MTGDGDGVHRCLRCTDGAMGFVGLQRPLTKLLERVAVSLDSGVSSIQV